MLYLSFFSNVNDLRDRLRDHRGAATRF